MSDDIDEVIAPRDDKPWETHEFLQQMMVGAYGHGYTVEFRGFELQNHSHDGAPRVWDVYGDEGYVDTLNLEAFRSVTDLETHLETIVAYDPADHEEWINR